jgi:hypothetical protein
VTQLFPATLALESDDMNLEDICAAEWAAYKQALGAVVDLDPDRLMMVGALHPVTVLDEAAVALFCAGWHAGVRAAQAASAGNGFVVPVTSCPRCSGQGRLWDGQTVRRPDADEAKCPACGGRGTDGRAGIG